MSFFFVIKIYFSSYTTKCVPWQTMWHEVVKGSRWLTGWQIMSVQEVFCRTSKSFAQNIKSFFKKFKEFLLKLLHIFVCCQCGRVLVFCFFFVLEEVYSLLYFTFLFFTLLCMKGVLIYSGLRRFRNAFVSRSFRNRCAIALYLSCNHFKIGPQWLCFWGGL